MFDDYGRERNSGTFEMDEIGLSVLIFDRLVFKKSDHIFVFWIVEEKVNFVF